MRFTSLQDYSTILKINKELVNTVVDTPVVIYKLVIGKTKINIYGEGTNKVYYPGVIVPALIDRQSTNAVEVVDIVDVEQKMQIAFLRNELESRNIYPETGDILGFDTQYYEIENANEVQLWAGQVIYNHSIVCDCHLSRESSLQIEKPII